MNPAEDRKGGGKRGGRIPVYYPAEYSLERALRTQKVMVIKERKQRETLRPLSNPQRPQKELCAICGVWPLRSLRT